MNTELQAIIDAGRKLIAEQATAEQRKTAHAVAEAERRNAEELRSEPPTPAQPEPEPDAMTRIAAALERIADRLDGFSDNLAEDALRVNVLR
jgi:hypothetical protein